MKTSLLTISMTFLVSGILPAVTTILYGPSLYFSEQDSPFIGGINQGTIYLENFEDQALNTPYVSVPDDRGYYGTTYRAEVPNLPDGSVWGVDGDDGVIDGQTFAGDTFISVGKASNLINSRMHFDFQPNILGDYPVYVGVVLTEVFDVDTDVEVGAGDLNGTNIISDGEFNPKDWRPSGGAVGGSPLIQRFVGVYHSEGITSLGIGNISQIDHLQYGYAIPEPASSTLLAFGTAFLIHRRKRVRTRDFR